MLATKGKSQDPLSRQFLRFLLTVRKLNYPIAVKAIPWSQRLSFNIIFFSFRNLRREALIEAPSWEKKKAFFSRL